MLDKSSVYNVLAKRMCFLYEVIKIFHMIFETRSQFLYKFCTIL